MLLSPTSESIDNFIELWDEARYLGVKCPFFSNFGGENTAYCVCVVGTLNPLHGESLYGLVSKWY